MFFLCMISNRSDFTRPNEAKNIQRRGGGLKIRVIEEQSEKRKSEQWVSFYPRVQLVMESGLDCTEFPRRAMSIYPRGSGSRINGIGSADK